MKGRNIGSIAGVIISSLWIIYKAIIKPQIFSFDLAVILAILIVIVCSFFIGRLIGYIIEKIKQRSKK